MPLHFLGPEGPLPALMEQTAADDPLLWLLMDVVDDCDLAPFEGSYRADGSGGRPYDPRLLLVSMLWCYQHQIRSPSAIADACRTHIALRVLWGGTRTPSRSTIERFLHRHHDGWAQFNIEILRICDRAGLLDVSTTATDSTPVTAPAARAANRSRARIRLQISETEQALDQIVARVAAQGAAAEAGQTGTFIDESCGDLLRQEQQLRRRLTRLRAAETSADLNDPDRARSPPRQALLDRIEHHRQGLHTMTTAQQQACDTYQAKVAAGRKPRGPAPRLPADHPDIRRKQATLDKAIAKLDALTAQQPPTKPTRANLTAPTSRILKGKNATRWVQGDLLTLTTGSNQIILAAQLPDTGNDHRTLHPHLAAVADNCHRAGITTPMTRHLADAGYASEAVFTTPTATGGTLYIAVTNEYDQTSTNPPTPDHNDTPGRREMTERLATTEGKAIYRRRTPMIEPVFAQLLRNDRRLHTRGPTRHTEVIVLAAAHNTKKYIRAKQPSRVMTKTH
jgi:hypothetical protein